MRQRKPIAAEAGRHPTRDDELAAKLLDAIVLAMTCPDPRAGMELLGHGVAVALGGDGGITDERTGDGAPVSQPQPLGKGEELIPEPPPGWDFAAPGMRDAIMGRPRPTYRQRQRILKAGRR